MEKSTTLNDIKELLRTYTLWSVFTYLGNQIQCLDGGIRTIPVFLTYYIGF
jgi:hypothetical protein